MQTIRMRMIEFRARQAALILFALALWWPVGFTRAAGPPDAQDQGSLKRLSLEQLGNLEVTTASKSPQQVWKTPAAIYVITQDDIRRSGALPFRRRCGWRPASKSRASTPTNGP